MFIKDYIPILAELNIVTITVRILLAMICGGMIGYTRSKQGKEAGFRTHILVCIGTAVAMLTGEYAFLTNPKVDPTRIGAQAISALGFLGAGSIIVSKNNEISGLTTAAGLWAAATIGLAIGIGYYELAIIGTVAILIAESILKTVDTSKKKRKKH